MKEATQLDGHILGFMREMTCRSRGNGVFHLVLSMGGDENGGQRGVTGQLWGTNSTDRAEEHTFENDYRSVLCKYLYHLNYLNKLFQTKLISCSACVYETYPV